MNLDSISCTKCGGKTKVGDLRSGVFSFGNYFVEHEVSNGDLKVKFGVEKSHVVSFVCTKCGYIESYLKDFLKGKEEK